MVWEITIDQESLKIFKSTNGLPNQVLPHSTMNFHSYAVELNCELFFIYIYLFYKFVIFEETIMQKKNN